MRRTALILASLGLIALLPTRWESPAHAGMRGIPKTTQIQLLRRGSGPKRALRYRFRAGQTVTLHMGMKMAMGMQLGSRRIPATSLPTMEMHMRIRVAQVSAAGNATLKFLLSGVTVKQDSHLPAGQIQALRQQMATLKGFSGTSVVSPRGKPLRSHFRVPPNVPAQSRQIIQNLQQQIKQLTAILPVQPVGVGARWRVRIPMHGPPISFVSELTYTLKAIRSTSVDVQVAVSGWAPPQAMQLPNMPAGASARIRSLSAHGAGTLKLFLTRPKSTGRLAATQSVESAIHMLGRNQVVKMNLTMSVRFR